MTTHHDAEISEQIEHAFALAESGATEAAAYAFASARALAVAHAPQLAQRVAGYGTALGRERIEFRDMIAERRSADRTMLILGDSLGLPRPESKSGPAKGADETYPMMLLDLLPTHQVESHCQRYFTSESVLQLLEANPELGSNADVVVHIGLNDCAKRMFLEPQRLALDALTPAVKDRMVAFAQRYRKVLLAELPALHYVDPHDFTAHLESVVSTLRTRSARRILLTTIILPPERFWPATPGINANFGDYNQRIMQVVERTGVTLFDLDRLVWATQHESVLLDDGMHLSPRGHRLFAERVARLVS